MRETRKREIRIKAEEFRGKCKVSRYGIIDLFKECERLGYYKLLRYPLGEEADLGFVLKKDNDTVIFTNTSSRLAREIFTLAHEIGHAVLHLENVSSFVDNAKTIVGNTDEKEQEANYFAVCLLMPEDEVAKFLDLEIADFMNQGLSAMDIARIMSEFNVSFETVLNRLESLGKIDSGEKLRLDNLRNQMRVGNLLKSVGGNSRLNEASNDIEIPHEYLEYVIYNYNCNAIPEETLENVLTCYQISREDISDKLINRAEEDDDDFDELIGGLAD